MRNIVRALISLLLVLAFSSGLTGCNRSGEPTPVARKRYPMMGKVVSLDKPRSRMTVEIQAIPGYMDAMTMSYDVKDPKELNDLEPGDEIRCDLILNGSDLWLQKIVITKKRGAPPEGKS